MSSATLTPTGSPVSNTGTLTGSSVAAAWTDNLDTTDVSYTRLQSTKVNLTDASPAIPSGAVISTVILYAKASSFIFSSLLSSQLATGTRSNTSVISILPSGSATWVAVNVWNVAGLGLVDADIDALTASVGNVGGDGALFVSELKVIVAYSVKPTLTVDAPTGTLTDRNAVTVSWTPTFDGSPLSVDYEVKIFDSATYGAGGFSASTSTPTLSVKVSGAPATTTSHAFTTLLANATYRAYVRLTANYASSTSTVSDWAYSGFVINTNKPGVPTLSLNSYNATGTIAVRLRDNAGVETTSWFEAQRSDDGGSTWQAIRTGENDGTIYNVGGAGGCLDQEAPNGTTVNYRARAVHQFAGGGLSYSAWTSNVSGSWSYTSVFIKHPTNPSLNWAGKVRSFATQTRAARQGVFQGLGSSTAIVVSDKRGIEQGDLTIFTTTAAERTLINSLISAGVPLLLQFPSTADESDRWVSIGDHSRTRLLDKSSGRARDESLPWVSVPRPSDVSLAALGLLPADGLITGGS